MKKWIKTLSIILLLMFSMSSTIFAREDQFENERLYFKDFHVEIEVSEEGLIKVFTTIDTFFNSSSHGIYAYIPQEYTMNFPSGEYRYYWPVKHFKNLSDHPVKIDSEDVFKVRFGDADVYVSGLQTYTYSYEIQSQDVDIENLDLFYFNILGEGWENPIENYSFKVTLPKSFDASKVFLYSGRYKDSGNEKIDYHIDGNVISGHNTQPLLPRESVTLEVPLMDGYFNFPAPTNYRLGLLFGLGIITLLAVLWFIKYGRDEKLVETVEVYPPAGLSSAMVGYIYDRSADTLDIVSLFIQWASKGYLAIEVDKEDDQIIYFEKLTDISPEEPLMEKRMFSKLFEKKDRVSNKDLENKFYHQINRMKKDIAGYFTKDKAIYNTTSDSKQLVLALLNAVAMIGFIFAALYERYNLLAFVIEGLIIGGITVLAHTVVSLLFLIQLSTQKKSYQFVRLVGELLITLVMGSIYAWLLNGVGKFDSFAILALGLYIVTLLFTVNMNQRTAYGNKMLGKIMGLKHFIEISEKDRLERLIDENPSYFFDVLPFAYVLGVSNKWAHKFENIAMQPPTGYAGSYPFSPVFYANRLTNSVNVASHALTSVPVSKNTGKGGFSGGSFGGGGGGGFSGGGFGGGGGGGW